MIRKDGMEWEGQWEKSGKMNMFKTLKISDAAPCMPLAL